MRSPGTLSSTQVASVKDGDSAQVAVDGETTALVLAPSRRSVPFNRAVRKNTYPTVIALPVAAQGLHLRIHSQRFHHHGRSTKPFWLFQRLPHRPRADASPT